MSETPDWQPTLEGPLLKLRPLKEKDFATLLTAASDPLIWELHPDRGRYKRERFEVYFRSGIESGGALVVIDRRTSDLIGSSRFTAYDPAARTVEIGYTFLTRKYWGGAYNRELKKLMLDHAFRYVDRVQFMVGERNFRSRRAMEKLGAILTDRDTRNVGGIRVVSVVYEIKKPE